MNSEMLIGISMVGGAPDKGISDKVKGNGGVAHGNLKGKLCQMALYTRETASRHYTFFSVRNKLSAFSLDVL